MSWHLKEKLQQVLSQEQGAMIYPPGSREAFALVYPNAYNVGMSNLGFQIIYQQINLRGDTACERSFLPDKKTVAEHIRTNTPLLTLETQRPLYEFPLVGFAISFEMDYFNFLDILNLSKIPLLATERQDNDPIVVIGGPCATFNPEPIADFVDVCIIGEGEETINRLLDSYYKAKYAGLSREEILLALAVIPGVYVPRFYEPQYSADGTVAELKRVADVAPTIKRQWIANLDDYPAQSVIVTADTEFSNMYLIEVARGCGRHCRFCMAGYCFRKPRVRSLANIHKAVLDAHQYRSKVGLMGAAISDYPDIDELCADILDLGMQLSVASLRADSLTPALVRALAISGHRTITLAPEAASSKLRQVINKGITDEHLERAVCMAIEAGIPNVRLYIMVGLPQETDEDIAAIVLMAGKIKKLMESKGSKGKLTLSVNPFIPKPFTPFQWLPMAESELVEKRLKKLHDELKHEKNIEVMTESPKEAYIQGVLARGDRKIAGTLLLAHQYGGYKGWRRAVKKTGLKESFYLYRYRDANEIMPWDHLDMGIERAYLLEELTKAEQHKATMRCIDNCHRCGVCVP